MVFSTVNPGSQAENDADAVGNHKAINKVGSNSGLLNIFNEDARFTEYLIDIDRNNYITAEDEKLFSFGEIMQTIKKEIVYVENKS